MPTMLPGQKRLHVEDLAWVVDCARGMWVAMVTVSFHHAERTLSLASYCILSSCEHLILRPVLTIDLDGEGEGQEREFSW